MIKYKIYINFEGWKSLNDKDNLLDVIKILDDAIAIGINEFIVIEINNKTGIEFPIITTERKLLKLKKELQDEKDKVYIKRKTDR